jgi:hypothetical protein
MVRIDDILTLLCNHERSRMAPFRHPGRDSEPGSSCPEARFNTGGDSEYGGFLDTGSEAGMTIWGDSAKLIVKLLFVV